MRSNDYHSALKKAAMWLRLKINVRMKANGIKISFKFATKFSLWNGENIF